MAKKKSEQKEIATSAYNVWLAGLGALSAAEEEGEKLFKSLVSRGQKYEKHFKSPVKKAGAKVRTTVDDARARAGRAFDSIEAAVDDQVTSALHRIGVPTRKEIAALTRRVEKLTQAVQGSSGPQRATKKKAPKKTAKKTATQTARSSKKTSR